MKLAYLALPAAAAVIVTLAGCSSGPKTTQAAVRPTGAPIRIMTASPAASPAAHPDPTFSYSGDPECAIFYGQDPDGKIFWVADVTVAGTLRTHAADTAGDLYPFVTQVTPGHSAFAAPQPLWKINDVGGVLYAADGKPYACSIAPGR